MLSCWAVALPCTKQIVSSFILVCTYINVYTKTHNIYDNNATLHIQYAMWTVYYINL